MRVRAWGSHLFLIITTIVLLYPLVWMVSSSFKPPNEIFGDSLAVIPKTPTFMNYTLAWSKEPILRYMWNSFYTSAIITVAQVVTSILAAYALSQFEFRGRNALFLFCIGTMMVPFHITMIPNYLLVSSLGWLDRHAALIVPQMANAFGIFMLRQYFLSYPKELLDAARIDGASTWKTLWGLVVPTLRSPIIALSMLFFLNTWNQYFWPLLVLHSPEQYTFPLGLQRFVHAEAGNNWGELMAAATMASVPVIMLYILLQRHVIESSVTTGLKG